MGGCGVGDRVGLEGKWWEQMYGGGKASRMGGSGRKGKWEERKGKDGSVILGLDSGERKVFVQQCWAGSLAEPEARSREPRWTLYWPRNEPIRAGLRQEWEGKDEGGNREESSRS